MESHPTKKSPHGLMMILIQLWIKVGLGVANTERDSILFK